MELKKYGCPRIRKESKYGYRAVGGILGIVLLMVLLLCGGTLLSLSLGINQKSIFSDPSDCCQCSGDRAGRPPGTAVDPGRHDLFSDRK